MANQSKLVFDKNVPKNS